MKTIFWAGDSTAKQNTILTWPQTGIAQMFDRFVRREDVRVENHAENGRSTKSFIDEGRLAAIYDRISEGDYLFIQFGHNDEKSEDPTRYADAEREYPANLERFVNAARNKGAKPVLISPVARRLFAEKGEPYRHTAWRDAMRETALRLDVPFIDLTAASEALIARSDAEEVRTRWYMNLPAGADPRYPEGQTDNTHLQPLGALRFGALIAEGLYQLGGEYRALLCEDYETWRENQP